MMAGLPGIRKRILGVVWMIIAEQKEELLDEEWIKLILEAKELGLTLEAVKEFFQIKTK
jgi:DNA-binding transcriptional regulator YhcF (GntR family)